ncbi:hypothetical protein TNCV_3161201 [Trichonephila clavipes]|nr:hypothetical protein TNCV_3161201 [Trichonephila clavipes]
MSRPMPNRISNNTTYLDEMRPSDLKIPLDPGPQKALRPPWTCEMCTNIGSRCLSSGDTKISPGVSSGEERGCFKNLQHNFFYYSTASRREVKIIDDKQMDAFDDHIVAFLIRA